MPAKAKTPGAPKKKRARSEHYVNNKEFLYKISYCNFIKGIDFTFIELI